MLHFCLKRNTNTINPANLRDMSTETKTTINATGNPANAKTGEPEKKAKAISKNKRAELLVKVSTVFNLLSALSGDLRQQRTLDVYCAAILEKILQVFLPSLAEFMAYSYPGQTKVTRGLLHECLGKAPNIFSKFLDTTKLVIVGGARIPSSVFSDDGDRTPGYSITGVSNPLILGELNVHLGKFEKRTKKLAAKLIKERKENHVQVQKSPEKKTKSKKSSMRKSKSKSNVKAKDQPNGVIPPKSSNGVNKKIKSVEQDEKKAKKRKRDESDSTDDSNKSKKDRKISKSDGEESSAGTTKHKSKRQKSKE